MANNADNADAVSLGAAPLGASMKHYFDGGPADPVMEADDSDHHNQDPVPELLPEASKPLDEEGNMNCDDEYTGPVAPAHDEESDKDASDSDSDEDDGNEEEDVEPCATITTEISAGADNEVERHEVAVSPTGTVVPQEAMLEASRTALFRRYSRLTPQAMEQQERSFHEENMLECMLDHHGSLCSEPVLAVCQDVGCMEQLRWRDVRILELQAALDHMTEAMAIQQRDMASQRIFVSRQAEQLTNLSNKLHQDKVALYMERERFQKSVAATMPPKSAKPATEKLKSPVKKLLSAATGRRASISTMERVNLPSDGAAARQASSSSSQLRLNPLIVGSTATAPMTERSTSLSTLELRTSSNKSIIALTPPKAAVVARVSSPVKLIEVTLNDDFNPLLTPPLPVPPVHTDQLDTLRREDRADSSSCLTSDQKKPSLGDRLRSIRWARS